jgi:HSP20 family protein
VAHIFVERRHVSDEFRRLAALLDESPVPPGPAGECVPPFDVIETASSVEVIMDLPGVQPDAIQVVFSRNTLVIAGYKKSAACVDRADAAFHLAERTFGRFARFVQLTGAYEAGAATASLEAGELRVVLPRIDERRGSEIRISVRAD